ncbi:MAG: hypothetical protein QOG00_864 [Pyrinomonadaceae bacterium]|nr:hypothetical protein [Pyrinomonadaceae bacterium]
MSKYLNRTKKRKKAEVALDDLFEQPLSTNVIHYSCESFYNRRDGTSPRITSIAIQNLSNGQTVSFSIHQIAERYKYSLHEIDQHYDELEREVLTEFYKFVQNHLNNKWVHWNMRDINYGFRAIEHRCAVLEGTPIHIPQANLFDLARMLIDIYGHDYISHPRLEKLMEKNGIGRKDFLSGREEAEAFEKKDYVKLHQSTLRKVDVMTTIAERAWNKSLTTNARLKDIYGSNVIGIVEKVTDHWLFKVLGIFGIIASIVGGVAVFTQ